MEILMAIIIFVLGLCFGSFVNMLIYRTAVRYKLINPPSPRLRKSENRSFCDYCGKQLNWYENVPVISWLILKGKTKCCHKKLSLSYPIVELLMGVLFVLECYILGFGFQPLDISNIFSLLIGLVLIINFVIIVFLVFSTVFDLKYMILPDFSTIILTICAIVLILGGFTELFLQNFLTALIAAGFLLVLNLITKGKGMGMGDVKLAIFMGLFLGFPKTIVAFYVAFIVGAVMGIFLMIFKKAKNKTQIPFGPFLILGTFISLWWGEMIIKLIIKNL